MTRHRLTLGSVALFSMLVLGGRTQLAAVTSTPTLSVVRSATIAGPNFVADFNGDGLPDVAGNAPVAPGANVSKVHVALGTGGAGFHTEIDTTFDGYVMGVGDVNGDGRLDLLVASFGKADDFLAVLPGNGDGTFGAFKFVAFTSGPRWAQVADMNGDGKADIVIVNRDGADGVDVMPGNGDFTFGTAVALTTGLSPNGGVVADLNGDGRPDLAVPNEDSHSVSVFLNQGAFAFSASDIPIDRRATGITAADVNGDGKIDLIATAADGGDTVMGLMYTAGFVYVFNGRGDGTFAAPAVQPVAPGAYRVVVGDFTRDGVMDIATANFSTILYDDCGRSQKTWDSVSILPGVGGGAFGAANNFSIGNQMNLFDPRYRNSTTTLTAADLNGDGALDLYTANGVFFLNQPLDPNWPPTVDLGPDQTINVTEITIGARADDVDQDMLTYSWTSSDGTALPPLSFQCLGGLSNGSHTFTVTVDDGHGHQATDSITITVDTGGGGSTGPTMTLTAPASGETITSGTPYTIKFHIDDPQMALYEWSVDYSADNGATWNHIWECFQGGPSSDPRVPTSRDQSCTWMNPGPPSTQVILTLYAQDDADAPIGTQSVVHIVIAPQPGGVPYPWQHQDIGAVAKAGTTTFSSGVFSVSGSGADIWGTADELQYAYLADPTGGGLTILEAHVDTVQNVAAWTKAGLMFRAGNFAGSPQASIFVTPGKGIAFQRRLTSGGTSVSTAGPLTTAPVWLRLTMFPISGGQGFRAYYRKNTTDPWTLVGQDRTTEFWWQPKAGLAVSSHADGTLATATFSSARAFAGADWHSNSIGAAGGKATADDTLFSVTGIGADIWGTSDQFEFVYQDCVGDCTITAHVRDVQNVNAWTKAGVMFRNTQYTGESTQVDAIVSPSKGVAMQYRATTGGASASAGALPGVAPGWLRLTRRGDLFTSFWSTDGVHFTQIGSVSVVMNTGVAVGLAVTSHNATTPATATFDSVTIQQP